MSPELLPTTQTAPLELHLSFFRSSSLPRYSVVHEITKFLLPATHISLSGDTSISAMMRYQIHSVTEKSVAQRSIASLTNNNLGGMWLWLLDSRWWAGSSALNMCCLSAPRYSRLMLASCPVDRIVSLKFLRSFIGISSSSDGGLTQPEVEGHVDEVLRHHANAIEF